jgi:hypothetical protein
MTKEEIIKEAINLSYVQDNRRFIRISFVEKYLPDVPILRNRSYTFSYFVWNLHNPDDIIIQKTKFQIHHKDKNSLNDNIDNLEKMTASKHSFLHSKGKHLGKNNPFYGKKHSEETKQLISKSSKNRIVSQETKDKISKALIGKTGRKFTKEHREKLSKSHKGKILTEQHKNSIAKAHIGKKASLETKKKLSKSKKGENNYWYGKKGKNHPAYGKVMSEKTKKLLFKANKGKIVSKEVKEKMSKSRKEWWRKKKLGLL